MKGADWDVLVVDLVAERADRVVVVADQDAARAYQATVVEDRGMAELAHPHLRRWQRQEWQIRCWIEQP